MARYTQPVASADAGWRMGSASKSYNGSNWFPAATDYQDKYRIPVHCCVVSPLPHPLLFLRSDVRSVSVLVTTILIPAPCSHFWWQVHLACPHSVLVPRNGSYEWTRLHHIHKKQRVGRKNRDMNRAPITGEANVKKEGSEVSWG